MTPLRKALATRGITGADLAKKIGANPSEISRWCSGSRSPSIPNRKKINKALGEAVYDLTPTPIACSECGRFIKR